MEGGLQKKSRREGLEAQRALYKCESMKKIDGENQFVREEENDLLGEKSEKGEFRKERCRGGAKIVKMSNVV